MIKQIADREHIDLDIVKNVFRSMEDIVFENLSSAPMRNNITIKIMSGLSLERKYIPKKNYSKGMFENLKCPDHVKIKSAVSKYYDKKINDALVN